MKVMRGNNESRVMGGHVLAEGQGHPIQVNRAGGREKRNGCDRLIDLV